MRKHVYFDDGTIKDHFRTHLLLTFLLSFDLFWIGEISASSVTIHQNLCSEQPKLTQCQAILNFDRLPTNYNCNPDQQNNCQFIYGWGWTMVWISIITKIYRRGSAPTELLIKSWWLVTTAVVVVLVCLQLLEVGCEIRATCFELLLLFVEIFEPSDKPSEAKENRLLLYLEFYFIYLSGRYENRSVILDINMMKNKNVMASIRLDH